MNGGKSAGLIVVVISLVTLVIMAAVYFQDCQTSDDIDVIRTNSRTTSENTTAIRNPTVDLPDGSLVRAGTHRNVYLLKRDSQWGLFRRLIVSNSLYPSYGWTDELVDSITAAQLQSIEESQLVRTPGGLVCEIAHSEEDKGILIQHDKSWNELSDEEQASVFDINWQEYNYHHNRDCGTVGP